MSDLRKEPRRVVLKKHAVAVDSKHLGMVLDISPSGLGIICAEQLTPQTDVTLSIDGKINNLEATVAWCAALPSSGRIIKVQHAFRWRVGLQFKLHSENDREQVNFLVTSL